MQTIDAYLEAEWESLSKLFTVEDQTDFSEHSLTSSTPSYFCYETSYPSLLPVNVNSYCFSTRCLSNPENCSQETQQGKGCLVDLPVSSEYESRLGLSTNDKIDGSSGLEFPKTGKNQVFSTDEGSSTVATENGQDTYSLKRKRDSPFPQEEIDDQTNRKETPNKNARQSRAVQNQNWKAQLQNVEELTPVKNSLEDLEARQTESSNCDISEENDIASEESNLFADSDSNKSTVLRSAGKKRATRGAATDPQSLYARKRRMRINERLRILQSLVPNGTKVDISTMLDEAFHYVKFLQLQIKLLSSDDLWMYAPIAYNGFDVALYRRMSPFQGLL